MYTATMIYDFKNDAFDEACKLWEKQILNLAKTQPGFMRMQFLTAKPKAMAIGTWKNQEYAQKFMQTGVFTKLMLQLDTMITEKPQLALWDLLYYAENKRQSDIV